MAWYMQSPSLQNRGIKVDGYANMQRPNVNLYWGMDLNRPQANRPQAKELSSNSIKVMNDTSDQEELTKLIKHRKAAQQKDIQMYNNRKHYRSQSSQGIQQQTPKQREIKNSQFSKKVRYLQNSLLPNCRKDTMDMILDHSLNKEVSLEQSRISKQTVNTSKRPQSHLLLGNGYNAFNPIQQSKKDLTQKLKEMYEYQQRYKQRSQKNHLKLG